MPWATRIETEIETEETEEVEVDETIPTPTPIEEVIVEEVIDVEVEMENLETEKSLKQCGESLSHLQGQSKTLLARQNTVTLEVQEMEENDCKPDIVDLVMGIVGIDMPIARTKEIGHGIDSKAIVIGKEIVLRK